MKKSIIINAGIAALLFSACAKSTITGTYRSNPPKIYEYPLMYLKGVRSWSVAQEIIIKEDSTFKSNSCNMMSGKWNVVNDSLYLFVATNRFRSDSFNKYGFNGIFPSIPEEPIKYSIEGNSLIQYRKYKKGKKSMHRLTKK